MSIVIVKADAHGGKTDQMYEYTRESLGEYDIEPEAVITVPGVHEIPIAVEKLLQKETVSAVIALGVLVTGHTDHESVLGYNVSKQLLESSCRHCKPVGYGIVGPEASWQDANEKLEWFATNAVEAVLETQSALNEIAEL